MIKDFRTYINEGLFDRNQSEFAIRKTDRGIEQVYVPKTKEDLYKYIDLDIEKAKRDGTYPDVDLNNIDISELGNDELKGLFSKYAYAINPDISDWDIKSIPSNYFKNNEQIKEFTISDSVTSIGDGAFAFCSGLTSVTIPNSVTSIGSDAFALCRGLAKTNYTGDIAGWCGINFADFGSSPTTYSQNLYINDVEVKDLVIPNGLTIIGSYAFSGCIGLKSITIPNSVTSIGKRSFRGCIGLTSVTIPNSVTSIGYRAFYGCSGLTSVTIPNSVRNIVEGAFEECSDLKDVTISKHCRIYTHSFPKDCKITQRDD